MHSLPRAHAGTLGEGGSRRRFIKTNAAHAPPMSLKTTAALFSRAMTLKIILEPGLAWKRMAAGYKASCCALTERVFFLLVDKMWGGEGKGARSFHTTPYTEMKQLSLSSLQN